jgi:hypothetical protein
VSLAIDPHRELDIRVGNQLRKANWRFDRALRRNRPYDFYDEIMEDLCTLVGDRWMDVR